MANQKIVKILHDSGDITNNTLTTVEFGSHNIYIRFEGYGDCASEDGHGDPIMIEIHNGVPRVIVWGDINKEDPTNIISLEGAQEDKRKVLTQP